MNRHLLTLPALALILMTGTATLAADLKKGVAAAKNGDFVTALNEWAPLAEQGDVLAQYYVGLLYQNGQGVAQDHSIAAEWYERAAKQGLSDAQYNLAVMYDNGFGVEQDYMTAISWYERSAEQGDADALYNLGKMHAKGLGVSKDVVRAYVLWSEAAQTGHGKARLKRDRLATSMSPEELQDAQNRVQP